MSLLHRHHCKRFTEEHSQRFDAAGVGSVRRLHSRFAEGTPSDQVEHGLLRLYVAFSSGGLIEKRRLRRHGLHSRTERDH